jgi:hypothetical protein
MTHPPHHPTTPSISRFRIRIFLAHDNRLFRTSGTISKVPHGMSDEPNPKRAKVAPLTITFILSDGSAVNASAALAEQSGTMTDLLSDGV